MSGREIPAVNICHCCCNLDVPETHLVVCHDCNNRLWICEACEMRQECYFCTANEIALLHAELEAEERREKARQDMTIGEFLPGIVPRDVFWGVII